MDIPGKALFILSLQGLSLGLLIAALANDRWVVIRRFQPNNATVVHQHTGLFRDGLAGWGGKTRAATAVLMTSSLIFLVTSFLATLAAAFRRSEFRFRPSCLSLGSGTLSAGTGFAGVVVWSVGWSVPSLRHPLAKQVGVITMGLGFFLAVIVLLAQICMGITHIYLRAVSERDDEENRRLV